MKPHHYTFGEELDEEIFPDAILIGGISFPIKRSTVPEITSLIYRSLDEPFDPDTYDDLGPRIEINLDLTDHRWTPPPPDLP